MRLTCRRMASRSAVYRPVFRALLFFFGAPDPCAPPCMRQRRRPDTAGERHAPPARVRAPHLGLTIMGPTLRACRSVTVVVRVRRTLWTTQVLRPVACGQRLDVADSSEGGRRGLQ